MAKVSCEQSLLVKRGCDEIDVVKRIAQGLAEMAKA